MFYSKKEKKRFQRLQNKGLKIALNKNSLFNTKLLHKKSRLANWEHRARLASCRLMYKYKFSPDYVEGDRHGTRLQQGPIFKQDPPSGSLKSCSYVFRKEWNSLPALIRGNDELISFKSHVKRYFWNMFFDLPQT